MTATDQPFDASKGAFFTLLSDLRLDGLSTVSLHRNGEDIHMRIQNHRDGEYLVAVLHPQDAAKLADALLPDNEVNRLKAERDKYLVALNAEIDRREGIPF